MVFSSLLFLFRFLPAALLCYYLTPARYKNFTLLLFSLIFYSWGEVRYFPLMMGTIVLYYFAGLDIEKHRANPKRCKAVLIGCIAISTAALLFFKYYNFFIGNINALTGLAVPGVQVVLPLGISFYTFQIMAYLIDVYRGDVQANRDFVAFGVFVTMFPQLIAGPIVRYDELSRELKSRRITREQLESGVFIFIMGLGSKVLIANNIGQLWDTMAQIGFERVSAPMAWLGLIGFSLQIYFDFSGYSLMAIGLGRMMGFEFPRNFNYPYIAKSATEFWRRWHITLGSWFRSYIYIPLGGSREGLPRQLRNLLIVWGLTGFWHGASWNFVLWGLYFGALIMIEKLFLLRYLEKSRLLAHLYLLFAAALSWALFKIEDLGELGVFLRRLFSGAQGTDWQFYLRSYGIMLVLAAVCATPLLQKLYEKIGSRGWVRLLLAAPVLILSAAYLVDSLGYNPFLYFRF